jgi:hypothetical protein
MLEFVFEPDHGLRRHERVDDVHSGGGQNQVSAQAGFMGQGTGQLRFADHAAPGMIGKTHLAQAIGYEAIKMNFQVLYRSIFDLVPDFMKDEDFNQQDRTLRRYLNPELLIIHDLGLKQSPNNSGEHLFEVIMRPYENCSTIMTSNRPLEEWGKLLGDVPTAGAILDRFLHHAQTIAITGRSYRLKDHTAIAGIKIKIKTTNPSPTNLRPQNRRAEWLAFRFCSFYFAADDLWKTLDFRGESAILTP